MQDHIRKYINLVEGLCSTEHLNEMPALISGDDILFLNDARENKKQARKLLALKGKVAVSSDGNLTLFKSRGKYFLFDANQLVVHYYMVYETNADSDFGMCAQQTFLWRSSTARGVAKTVFDLLLREYDTILSDDDQTDDGARFWVTRMEEAYRAGLTVGITTADLAEWSVAPKGQDFAQWLKEHDGWNSDNPDEDLYFITKKNISGDDWRADHPSQF